MFICCLLCHRGNNLILCLRSPIPSGPSEYVGHYIVVVGYQREMIAYLDPALSSGPSFQISFPHFLVDIQWMPFETFESARKSLGTDEDILFCHKSSNIHDAPSFLRILTDNGSRFILLFLSSMFKSSYPYLQHQPNQRQRKE